MSTCTELGYPPAVGGTLLGRSLGKFTDTCSRLSLDGILTRASEDAAPWIAAAMRGESPTPVARVIKEERSQAGTG